MPRPSESQNYCKNQIIQEKALVGAFSVILELHRLIVYTALMRTWWQTQYFKYYPPSCSWLFSFYQTQASHSVCTLCIVIHLLFIFYLFMGAWAMGDNVKISELVRQHILSSYVCVLLCAFERKLKPCQASNKDFIDINVTLSIHLVSIQSEKQHFQALVTLNQKIIVFNCSYVWEWYEQWAAAVFCLDLDICPPVPCPLSSHSAVCLCEISLLTSVSSGDPSTYKGMNNKLFCRSRNWEILCEKDGI